MNLSRDQLENLSEHVNGIEYSLAREKLAVYAGLLIPSEVEKDDPLPLQTKPQKLSQKQKEHQARVNLSLAKGKTTPSVAKKYIPAAHHRKIIEKLEQLESREMLNGRVLKRLMILAPPGSAKSTYASIIFPAWYLGRHPTHDVIGGSQTQELADRFGRKCRNAVTSQTHGKVFSNGVSRDSRAAGQWTMGDGGEYKAVGVTPFAGRRANLVVMDDLIRGQKDADSPAVRKTTWEWYLSDVRPRMKPNAAMVYITTRWNEDDPAGRILPKNWNGKSGWIKARDGEWWYVLSFVAIIETSEEKEYDPVGRKMHEILWKEWFTMEMLTQERRTQGTRNWNSLYQQKPREDEGGILKASHWRMWHKTSPPAFEYILTMYDTAFEEKEENDSSARTDWGVFWNEETMVPVDMQDEKTTWYKKPKGGRYCCMLIDAWEDKVEFPKLRREAKRHYYDLKPDKVGIEKKASGHSLLQELRKAGIPVVAIKADKSKLARAHVASVVLEDGCIYYMDRRWAEIVIEKCARATFIKGMPGNDTADTCVHAWNYLRKMFHLQTTEDPEDEDEDDEGYESTSQFRSLYG
jgi:predicted phage terminase large subunit-like protein